MAIDKIAEKHTPLPWRACNDGKCSCKKIWCPDYPVAVVQSGDWGDDYPSIRLVGESSLELKAEAYMEQCTYGHIPEELAEANIKFIIQACNSYYGLVEALKNAQAQLAFFMKNRFPSNTLGETLAKIDKALEGVK